MGSRTDPHKANAVLTRLPSDQPSPLSFAPSRRISAQGGIFTIQKDPTSELQKSYEDEECDYRFITLLKLTIEATKETQRALWRLGIRESSIYPDLEGLAVETKASDFLDDCLVSDHCFYNPARVVHGDDQN